MLKNVFATLFMLLFVATSCEKADLITNGTDVTLTNRTSTGFIITLKTVSGDVLTLPASTMSVTGLSPATFGVILTTETGGTMTYTAVSATVSDNESNLRVTANGGTTTYTNISVLNVEPTATGNVLLKIAPSGIVITFGSAVVDEIDNL